MPKQKQQQKFLECPLLATPRDLYSNWIQLLLGQLLENKNKYKHLPLLLHTINHLFSSAHNVTKSNGSNNKKPGTNRFSHQKAQMWFLRCMAIACYCEELQRSRTAGKGLWHIWNVTRVYLEGILIETENSQLRSESLTSFPPPKQEIPGGKLIPFQPWLLKAEGKGALSWPGRVTSDFMLLLGTLLNPVVWSWERDTPKKKKLLNWYHSYLWRSRKSIGSARSVPWASCFLTSRSRRVCCVRSINNSPGEIQISTSHLLG